MRKAILPAFLGAFLIVPTGCGMQHETSVAMPVESVMVSDTTDDKIVPETTMISTTMEAPTETEPAGILHGIKIGLDPGHQAHPNAEQEPIAPGSTQTKAKVLGGAVGSATGIPEYVTVLEIAEFLKADLEAEGAEVYMTRETHDVDISNIERAEMMNEAGVDLMLRIHCDGASDSSVHGVALYVSESNAIAEQSRGYAEIMLPVICEALGAKNRGITQNDNYTGQNWAEVPCIMIECGFLSNPEEDQKLNDAVYQKQLADAITQSIVTCFADDPHAEKETP